MASVLVVDGEPDLRDLAHEHLELDGHHVTTATDGAGALAAIQDRVPDIVVLDVTMPEAGGWTLLQQLKGHRDHEVSSVPVVAVTAPGADHDRLRSAVEGAVRNLVKPVVPDDLRRAVREVLAGAPERDQRRHAQTSALVELARRERGGASEDPAAVPGPRLSRLERPRPREPVEAVATTVVDAELTNKQRQLLEVLRTTPSVSEAAKALDVSRSNVYASLRRIARKLDRSSVPELLRSLRAGDLRIVDR